MIKPVDYNSEKCRVIDNWKKRVINPMEKSSTVNRGYLVAATVICELCIKDVIEQTLGLFIPPDRDGERNGYLNLTHEHDSIYLNNKLRKLTDEEYSFPPLCEELDARNMEKILYEDMDLNIEKEKLQRMVDMYIKRHDELLEDYEQRRHQLKISLRD